MRRLRELSEAECYARCYGGFEATIAVARAAPRRSRGGSSVSGEELRLRLEERLDARLADGLADGAEAA